MKTSLRLRLSTTHLLVLIIGMVLAGSLAWIAVERVYLSTQEENLLAQARLTAAALEGTVIFPLQEESYTQTTNVSPGIHSRLLDEGGAVIIGVPLSEGDIAIQMPAGEDPGYVPAEELISRPEIQSALAGQADTAHRKIDALEGQRVLYAAAPVFDQSGEVINLVYLATPLPRRGIPSELAIQLLGAVIAAFLLAGIIGLFLARGIAQPLESLERSASAISEGDFSKQVDPNAGIREIDNLNQSFNQMSANLRFSEQAKNAFIADVTHELRTPLTVIKGTVETLEDGAMDDLEGRGRLLNSLGKESNRMIRLVNDLLTLTRADASALKLNLQPLDLGEAVRERCLALTPLAARKNILLQYSELPRLSQNSLMILADADRVAQVLDNILDNAIRHSPNGSPVSIELDQETEMICCIVRDQGPGIPAEHLPLIFERFYRVDSARDRSTGGTGLGLAIARSLVLAQGGEIQAESPDGKGTQIIIHFPRFRNPS